MKPVRKLNGYATIEAVIVIPMIIVTIFSILFIIRIFYIQATVQTALDEACNDFAYYAYLYEKSSLLEVTNKVEKDWTQSDANLNESYQTFKASVEGIMVNIDSLKNVKFESINKLNQYNSNGKNLVEVVSDYIDMTKGAKTEIGSALGTAYEVVKSSTNILDTIKGISIRDFGKTAGLAVWSKAETFVGNSLIKSLMKASITEEKMFDYVEAGYEGLDFSKSNYFYDHTSRIGENSVVNGNMIDVVVVYEVKMIELLPFFGDVRLISRVTMDTWTGANN